MLLSKSIFFLITVLGAAFAWKFAYDAMEEYTFVYRIRNLICPTIDSGEVNIEAVAAYLAGVACNSIQIEFSSLGEIWNGFSPNASWKARCASLELDYSNFTCLISARKLAFNNVYSHRNYGLHVKIPRELNRRVNFKKLVFKYQIKVTTSGRVSIIEATEFRAEVIYSKTVIPVKIDLFYKILLDAIKTVSERTFCMIPMKM